GVDPRPVWQTAALEAADVALVLDGIDGVQPQFLDPLPLLLLVRGGEGGLLALDPHPVVLAQVRKVAGVFPTFRSVVLVERHVTFSSCDGNGYQVRIHGERRTVQQGWPSYGLNIRTM